MACLTVRPPANSTYRVHTEHEWALKDRAWIWLYEGGLLSDDLVVWHSMRGLPDENRLDKPLRQD